MRVCEHLQGTRLDAHGLQVGDERELQEGILIPLDLTHLESRKSEEEYFYNHDRELLETIRRQAAADKVIQELGAVTGIEDEDILRTLQQLNFDEQTVVLLGIVPLVQVAWSDGSVNDREREEIFRIAQLAQVVPEDPSWCRLSDWLKNCPSEELFQLTLEALRASFRAASPGTREQRMNELVSNCTVVASASGGLWRLWSKISDAEQLAIRHIVDRLEPNSSTSKAENQ
jgi:hypothetical protein